MTKSTYDELFELRSRLLDQVKAIDLLIGAIGKQEKESAVEEKNPIRPASLKSPNKPRKTKENPKFPWSKKDTMEYIINTIKVHHNTPLSVEELIMFSPFEENKRYELQARLSTALISMYNGEVLTRRKQPSPSGKICYHYNFP